MEQLFRLGRFVPKVMAYAFRGWFRKTPATSEARITFSHQVETNWTTIALTLCVLSLVEGGLVHWGLSAKERYVAAAIAGALHLYGILSILGDMHALRLRPSILEGDTLHLTIGLRSKTQIELSNIETLSVGEFGHADINKEDGVMKIFGDPNLCFHLKENIAIETLLGTKEVRVLYLQLDEPEALIAAYQKRIS